MFQQGCRGGGTVASVAGQPVGTERGLLDLFVGATNGGAMLAQDIQFARELGQRQAREEVAGVGVLRYQSQSLALAAAANQYGWVRLLHSAGRVERARKMVMLALVGRVVAFPHLVRDLQRLFQPLKA